MLNGSNWIPFNSSSYYYTTGILDINLVVIEKLFKDFPLQIIWKIELVTKLVDFWNQPSTGYTSVVFYVNFSPSGGTCDIFPKVGDTNTLFNIFCNQWVDSDGYILSYAFYGISFLCFKLNLILYRELAFTS